MAAAQTDTGLIKNYFEMNLAAAKAELTSQGGLTKEDKAQLAAGIRDGSLTYEATSEQAEAAHSQVIKVPDGRDLDREAA